MTDSGPPAGRGGPRFCAACRRRDVVFTPGPGGRPGAACAWCRSLERHRFLALLLAALGPRVTGATTVLDIAPQARVHALLREHATAALHVGLDLHADLDVDVRGDVTRLPLRAGSVDLLVCYHVLEHVPDDATAMAELRRVLAPAGTGLLQVPYRPTARTDEDPTAPVAERVRRFGQADHVRWYGGDFDDRLRAAGLLVQRVDPAEVLPDDVLWRGNIAPHEPVWLVRPHDDGDDGPVVALTDVRAGMAAALDMGPPARLGLRARLAARRRRRRT